MRIAQALDPWAAVAKKEFMNDKLIAAGLGNIRFSGSILAANHRKIMPN